MKTHQGHQFFAALLFVCIFTVVTAMVADCQQSGVIPDQRTQERKSQDLTSLRHTLDDLRKVKVKGRDVDIPARVRLVLAKLKHRLRDRSFVTLNDKADSWSTPREGPYRRQMHVRRAGPLS